MAIDGISGTDPSQLDAAKGRSKPAGKPNASTNVRTEDTVSFSDTKQEFARIRQMVDSVPEIRWDRVRQLAQMIDLGTYNVANQDLADAIIEKGWIDLTA
jgi:flagellar biosynthesis anti-sigma factor FlgM